MKNKNKEEEKKMKQFTLPTYIEYTDLKVLKTQELLVACPQSHYQIEPLVKCKKCEFFGGLLSEHEYVICNYKPARLEKVDPQNKLNELTGSEWLFFTKSVIMTSYPLEFKHELRQELGASKPPRLMELIIRFFTKTGEWVLDPFMGTGATLIAASLSGRKALGIEINPRWIEIYRQVCEEEKIEEQEVIQGDCLEIMSKLIQEGRCFDAIITDPPYSPALEKTLTLGDYPQWRRRFTRLEEFSNDPRDFRNTRSFSEYYSKMKQACELMYNLLKPERYMAMIIRDSYQDGRYIPTSFHVAQKAEEAGFIFKGIKIWYQAGAPVRPYGYPFSYVPNIIHHSILIFKKGK
ncbi:MAG: DNA methyltransferase [Nitrososphaerota archaeon]